MTRLTAKALLVLLAALAPGPLRAVTLGQVDDFEDETVANWAAQNFIPVTNVDNAGPLGAGDRALDAVFTNRFVIPNDEQWTGNYIAAGVTRISFDVQHQNDFPLALRLGIANGELEFGGTGDTYVTSASIAVPNDGVWRRITFDFTPADFAPSTNNNTVPPDAATALMNVTQLRILHNPAPNNFQGQSVPGSFRLDNILADDAPAEDADFDDDQDVDGADFLTWQQGVGEDGDNSMGDADGNGTVDGLDLAVWRSRFGDAASLAAGRAVPEPCTLVLLLSAGLAVRAGIRSRRTIWSERRANQKV